MILGHISCVRGAKLICGDHESAPWVIAILHTAVTASRTQLMISDRHEDVFPAPAAAAGVCTCVRKKDVDIHMF